MAKKIILLCFFLSSLPLWAHNISFERLVGEDDVKTTAVSGNYDINDYSVFSFGLSRDEYENTDNVIDDTIQTYLSYTRLWSERYETTLSYTNRRETQELLTHQISIEQKYTFYSSEEDDYMSILLFELSGKSYKQHLILDQPLNFWHFERDVTETSLGLGLEQILFSKMMLGFIFVTFSQNNNTEVYLISKATGVRTDLSNLNPNGLYNLATRSWTYYLQYDFTPKINFQTSYSQFTLRPDDTLLESLDMALSVALSTNWELSFTASRYRVQLDADPIKSRGLGLNYLF